MGDVFPYVENLFELPNAGATPRAWSLGVVVDAGE
jgi:hypothetical protein